MNIIDYLVSINKISILAFIVTLGFLGWEWRQLQREKQKAVKPEIPQFNANASPLPVAENQIIAQLDPATLKRTQYHKVILIVLIIMVIIFGVTSIFSIFWAKKGNSADQAQVVVRQVKSAGIIVYDNGWQQLKGTNMAVQPGDDLIIGVATIKGLDIDKARIRVNDNQWRAESTTDKFDIPHGVYYRIYKISSSESKLQIEAQLHSKSDGWLSD